VSAPDPFVAPYFSFLLERTPKGEPESHIRRKDEYQEAAENVLPPETVVSLAQEALPGGWLRPALKTAPCPTDLAVRQTPKTRRDLVPRMCGLTSTERREPVSSDHRVGTREEWRAAREELLVREKEHTHLGDELARQRRELPWVPVEKEYRFQTETGNRSLAELFEGRSQLLVHHFMFGPSYEAGCPICSSAADTLEGTVAHLNQRDVTFVRVSRAPVEKLLAYRRRMGWTFPPGSRRWETTSTSTSGCRNRRRPRQRSPRASAAVL
jgi:predicted dithiol-disulfide oxidoreductase (DUF899 family)